MRVIEEIRQFGNSSAKPDFLTTKVLEESVRRLILLNNYGTASTPIELLNLIVACEDGDLPEPVEPTDDPDDPYPDWPDDPDEPWPDDDTDDYRQLLKRSLDSLSHPQIDTRISGIRSLSQALQSLNARSEVPIPSNVYESVIDTIPFNAAIAMHSSNSQLQPPNEPTRLHQQGLIKTIATLSDSYLRKRSRL